MDLSRLGLTSSLLQRPGMVHTYWCLNCAVRHLRCPTCSVKLHQQGPSSRCFPSTIRCSVLPPAGARLPLEMGPAMSTAGSCLAESGALELSGLLLSKQCEDGSQDGRWATQLHWPGIPSQII